MKSRLLLALSLLIAFAADVSAESVYRWEDKTGKVHYSSKAPHQGAKPADLPEITRGEVKLTSRKLVTCKDHGDINCQLGPDSDGSVICYDGFKNASAIYRFTCNSPKLEVADISSITDDGKFTVFVRNSKSVTANKPALLFKPEGGKEIRLEGPDNIDAFGVAEFEYQFPQGAKIANKPTLAQLNITCANCP